MASDPSAIGVTDGAFFVSKSELLDWLRTDFQINISKVEECGNGVVYLQIMDRLYPGKVPMRKVKINAKQAWESLHNLKILQSFFTEQGIKKYIDIDRLAKCVYSENLEFLQWMKRFYDRQSGDVYHGLSGNGVPGEQAAQNHRFVGASCATSSAVLPGRPVGVTSGVRNNERGMNRLVSTNKTKAAVGGHPPNVAVRSAHTPCLRKDGRPSESIEKLRCTLEQRNQEIAFLRQELEETERESQFYFGKLRALEMLAGAPNRKVFTVKEIETILFTEENMNEEQLANLVLQQNDTISSSLSATASQPTLLTASDVDLSSLPPTMSAGLVTVAPPVSFDLPNNFD